MILSPNCLRGKVKSTEPVELLGRAIELEPRMAFGWMHMGDILLDVGRIEEGRIRLQESSAWEFALRRRVSNHPRGEDRRNPDDRGGLAATAS